MQCFKHIYGNVKKTRTHTHTEYSYCHNFQFFFLAFNCLLLSKILIESIRFVVAVGLKKTFIEFLFLFFSNEIRFFFTYFQISLVSSIFSAEKYREIQLFQKHFSSLSVENHWIDIDNIQWLLMGFFSPKHRECEQFNQVNYWWMFFFFFFVNRLDSW